MTWREQCVLPRGPRGAIGRQGRVAFDGSRSYPYNVARAGQVPSRATASAGGAKRMAGSTPRTSARGQGPPAMTIGGRGVQSGVGAALAPTVPPNPSPRPPPSRGGGEGGSRRRLGHRQPGQQGQQRGQVALGDADQVLRRRRRRRPPPRAAAGRPRPAAGRSGRCRRRPSAAPARRARSPGPAPPAAPGRAAARSPRPGRASAPAGSPRPSSTRPQRRKAMPARSVSPHTTPSAPVGGSGAEARPCAGGPRRPMGAR